MRGLSTVLTLMVALLACPKLVRADEPKVEGGERVRERLAARMADLHLTDEQEMKIAEIRKDCRSKIKEAGGELAAVVKDEAEKVRALLTADQREKLDVAEGRARGASVSKAWRSGWRTSRIWIRPTPRSRRSARFAKSSVPGSRSSCRI